MDKSTAVLAKFPAGKASFKQGHSTAPSSPQIIVNGAEKLLEKVRPSVIGYEDTARMQPQLSGIFQDHVTSNTC